MTTYETPKIHVGYSSNELPYTVVGPDGKVIGNYKSPAEVKFAIMKLGLVKAKAKNGGIELIFDDPRCEDWLLKALRREIAPQTALHLTRNPDDPITPHR